MTGPSRELTVVRIPLRSAKHHFGVSVSRGTRPYNEDTYQAGTIEIPAFAKRAPVSLSRSTSTGVGTDIAGEATSAGGASGDPQVFYFGVFDGHGGHECSDFLKDELHEYIESASEQFELTSSLQKPPHKKEPNSAATKNKQAELSASELSSEGKDTLSAAPTEAKDNVKISAKILERNESGRLENPSAVSAIKGEDPVQQAVYRPKAMELELSLVRQWKETVGGYFRRFKPEYFSIPSTSSCSDPTVSQKDAGRKGSEPPISIETVLMYAFLRADLDFVTAQASKPDPETTSDLPLNDDEILGEPSHRFHKGKIGGPTRFKGGSTASVAMISTPTPTPFWHPASPSTLLVAHVGDTRILLCETSTGLAVPTTTNHHPSSPGEGSRLRRYAATFVTDSFGEERMSGLANTRAFGDMRSKRIGVSAEPELRRYELAPAQYSFLVLVSDGVSGTLSDQEIVDVVKEARTPEQGAKDVVAFATEVSREGDNATCLVIRLGGWERRGEGGMGSLGTKEARDFRRQDATDPRTRRT
jgi:protein phosphatase PTC6